MKTKSSLFLLFPVILLLVLAACTPAAEPTATQLPPTSSPTAILPTAIPPTATFATTSQPLSSPTPAVYPMLPTATVGAGDVNESGYMYSVDKGFELTYPVDWVSGGDVTDFLLLNLTTADNGMFFNFFVVPNDTSVPAEEAHNDINTSFMEGTSNNKTISHETVSISGSTESWSTVSDASLESGVTLRVRLVSAVKGSSMYVLFFVARTADYSNYSNTMDEVVAGLKVFSSGPLGIPHEHALILEGGETTNPREYDPATTHSGSDKLIYSGLVSFNTKLQLIPDLAETWTISPDGTVYTFTLRENAVFHNGRPVTAWDFVYSWERAADPATESDTVLTYMGDIVGMREMHEGSADHISGLTVVDEHTLQVTIDAPKPYFLLKLTYPVAFVLDQQNIETGAEWYRTPNGTGPYRLARWESFSLMLYEHNEQYYLGTPSIPFIIYKIYAGIGEQLYESGEIDVTGVSSFNVDRYLNPDEPMSKELLTGVSLCTNYYTFDVSKPPFDDVKVRQAFTMAFDRQKYIDVVLSGKSLPAKGLYPPALPGYNDQLVGLPYDPEQARQLLNESKYGGAAGLPPIVFTDGGFGSSSGGDTAALIQMWEQNLGVTITVENLEPNKFTDMVYAGKHGQIFSSGWCADYPDPENFADALFHTGADQNRGNYSNPELDALLEQARVEQDVAKRIQLYQQAEQIIVNDAPALFTTHSLSYLLVKPYVIGYVLTPITIPLEFYLKLDPEKMK